MRNVLWIIMGCYGFRAILELSYGKYFHPGEFWDHLLICLLDGALLAGGVPQ